MITEKRPSTIYVVFALPLTRPGDRDFLGAYTTQDRAQNFVDAQDPAVRENLAIVEVTLDRHPRGGDLWAIPERRHDRVD